MTNPSYTVGGQADWSLIPDYMIDGLRRYIENGVQPGDFLTALLSNDLFRTFERADDTNSRAVRNYVQFLYNYAPGECWGSEERFKAWLKSGGLTGQGRWKREAESAND